MFDLLREWPSASFRQPLVVYFSTKQEYEVECAEALLAFRDDELTKLVESHEGVRGRVASSRFERQRDDLTDLVRNMQLWANRHDIPVAAPFVSLDGFLPERRPLSSSKLNWAPGITVDAAVRQMHDPDLSVRLQCWSWLAERGIIASTDDVIVAWPHFNDDHRRFITSVRPRFSGRARLLNLFEKLAPISSEMRFVQDDLVVGQVQLGSASVIPRARKVLNDAIDQNDVSYELRHSRRCALKALCERPSVADVSLLIRISRGDSEYDAGVALEGLARIDDPEAIDEVGKFLTQPTDGHEYFFIVRAIQQQSIKQLRHRGRYLAVLATALRNASKINADRRGRDWGTLRKLGDAFVCMSGQDFREAIQAEIKKDVARHTVGVSWSSSKEYRAHSRLIYQDAGTSIAKVCLHWYSQQSEDDANSPQH